MYKTVKKDILKIFYLFITTSMINASSLIDTEVLDSLFYINFGNNFADQNIYKIFKGFILSNKDTEIADEIRKFNVELDNIGRELEINVDSIKIAKLILLFNWYRIENPTSIEHDVMSHITEFIEQLKNKNNIN